MFSSNMANKEIIYYKI